MSNGNIFYSQVDFNLQAELDARGKAGRFDRSNASLNYMLEKVANVEIIAMKNQKHVDLTNTENEKNILHRLGGKSVRSGEYLPTGNNGFLNDRVTKISDPQLPSGSADVINSSYRIAPFITSAEMKFADHSAGPSGYVNEVTVNIVIPNPDRDLDFMESVYARPGRAVTMIIEHPESAVITNDLLTTAVIQPAIVTNDSLLIRKMNRVSFNGLIKSFTYSYQIDGTVAMTVHLIGTSNIYTDTPMTMYRPNISLDVPIVTQSTYKPKFKTKPINLQSNTLQTSNFNNGLDKPLKTPAITAEPITFYKQIYNDIDRLYKENVSVDTNIKKSYLIYNKLYNDGFGITEYESDDATYAIMYDWNGKEQRYITLALLIKFINIYIISKQQSLAPNASIICSDKYCKSNFLSSLVSSNPTEVWIPGAEHDVYGDNEWYADKSSSTTEPKDFSINNESFPSHIFINLNSIERIINDLKKTPETYKATNFLIEISKLISESTGNFINMKLISYPPNPDYLVYYDANYKGSDSYNVKPYSIPMFANHPNGTIVREFRFESKLPQDMQSLMYTVNQSDTISEEKIAPFLNYMYNNRIVERSTDNITGTQSEKLSSIVDPAIKAKLDSDYRASHEKYKTALNTAKINFAKDGLTNNSTRTELQTTLTKHIQWPTPTIEKTSLMTAAIYPMEVDFTIDGINGFRYGDTLEFNALPAKYKTNTTFSITEITHTVSTAGDWTTNIKCIMRPKFE